MDARTAYRRAAIVLVAVVVVDQATKALVRHSVHGDATRRLVPGVVKLVAVRNSGIAFSALSNGGVIIPLVIAAAIVALLAYFVTNPTRPWAWLAVGLLLGGAVGNAIDRIRLGSVTDFVKFPYWPAFNIADAAITIGVVILVVALETRDDAAAERCA